MLSSMRSARPKIAHPAGFDSAARAELALAIAARSAIESRLEALSAARDSLWSRIVDGESAVEAASATVDRAKAGAVAAVVEALTAGAVELPATVHAAREALRVATDDLDTARSAKGQLAVDTENAEQALTTVRERVKTAARAVLFEHPSIARLVDKVTAAQRELATMGGLLTWLIGENVVPVRDSRTGFELTTPDAELALSAKARMSQLPTNWNFGIRSGRIEDMNAHRQTFGGRMAQVAAEPWAHALVALEQDAQASLPLASL